MGMSWSRSHRRTWREGFPLVHHLPQRTKQRGLERGTGRSHRPRQCPEGCRHGGLRRGDRQGVEEIVLTTVESVSGGPPSPYPDGR